MHVAKETWVAGSAAASSDTQLEVLSRSTNGAWTLNLPPELRDAQNEIESLLGRVFADKSSLENFQRAQQMTLNWCLSKWRKMGLSPDDTEWL